MSDRNTNIEFQVSMITLPKIEKLLGSAIFQLGETKFKSNFELEYTSAKALIKFAWVLELFPLPSGLIFNGQTTKGMLISGEVDSYNNNITDKVIIADLTYLHIGNEDVLNDMHEVKTRLLGIYYPHNFSIQYENCFIEFRKPEWSIDEAKRTKEATGAILEGNETIIKGEKLTKTKVEELLIDICFLLRPICSGEVYFGHYVCNNSLMVFPKNINIKGTLFGMQENLLNSVITWKELFTNGLSTYQKLEPIQKQEYHNIGYALSTSAGCGTMETALANLIQTLEYLGNNIAEDNIQKSNNVVKNQIKAIRSYLKESFELHIKENNLTMPENIILGIKDSINRIQPWKPETLKKVISFFYNNGWKINFDFKEFKDIRDELAHNGMVPKEISYNRRNELQELYETILFIHALDIIGLEGRVFQRGNDGWKTFPYKREVKNYNI